MVIVAMKDLILRSKRAAARRCLVPKFNGAPDWIRTSGPQIRNLMLYPAELRVHNALLGAPGALGQCN
jgi:hypothetical protein